MDRDATARDSVQRPLKRFLSNLPVWMLIASTAFLLRLAPLNRYVTPDEPAWVLRSIRFGQALASGDLSAIPATGHPGVTTMWLGSLGIQIQRWLAPDQAAAHLDWLDGLAGLSPKSAAVFGHLAFFLSSGRIVVAVVTSLGLVGVFALSCRLWGRSVGVLGAILLVGDPFLVGHSGLLHLDGLLATGMTLSALAALLAVYPSGISMDRFTPALDGGGAGALSAEQAKRRASPYFWAIASGIAAGLAVLTKIPAGFLAPFVGVLWTIAWLSRRISWQQALGAMILWGLIVALVLLILYPSLWVALGATVRGILDVGGRHVEGALRPIFFHGQTTYDPPPTFYPVVWLFRVSPVVLIGLLVALVIHTRRPGPRRFVILALVIQALGFGLLVTLVGKKHDRYLLPAFPPLILIAALGWDEIRASVDRRLGPPNGPTLKHWLVPVALILAQVLIILPYLSAPLGYFNPLLGGPKAALNWLDIGWGEGEGAVARWLNQDSDAEKLIVATASIPPFASIFDGQSVPLDDRTRSQADYILRSPVQGLESPREPEVGSLVFDKQVGGISLGAAIRNSAPREQAAYLDDHARRDDLIVLDADAALVRRYEGPADLVVMDDARDPIQVAAGLDPLVAGRQRLWYVALPVTSPITARYLQQRLACYGQVISSEAIAGVNISRIVLDSSQACDAANGTHLETRFESLVLVDAFLPSEPTAWPDHLFPVIRWDLLASLASDYRPVLHLKDEAGHIWVEGGQEILNADYQRLSAWSPGDWADQTFRLALPPAIPPGLYTVELGMFDPLTGKALGAWDAAGGFAGLSVNLGQVAIDPPPNPPTPWDMVVAKRFDPPLAAGSLVLLGHDPPTAQLVSGDRVSFDLFWRATVAPDAEYSLRWRLRSPESDVALEEKNSLSPYPTDRWRAGELEQVRHDLLVPPDLAQGSYDLFINVFDGEGDLVWDDDVLLARVEVLVRDRLFSLPTGIAYPLDLRLGNVVGLRGFDIGALLAAPGDHIPLTLYWQADGPTDLSYSVFVHLVGRDGMIYGQEDRPPANGAAPTHSWAPGQVIIDEISLPVWGDAPPGTYHVSVGLYHPDSAHRLPVFDATGAELPNSEIVLPVEVTVE